MSTSCRQMFVPHHIRIVQNGNNENSFIHDQGHQLTTKEIDSMSILKGILLTSMKYFKPFSYR